MPDPTPLTHGQRVTIDGRVYRVGADDGRPVLVEEVERARVWWARLHKIKGRRFYLATGGIGHLLTMYPELEAREWLTEESCQHFCDAVRADHAAMGLPEPLDLVPEASR